MTLTAINPNLKGESLETAAGKMVKVAEYEGVFWGIVG